MNSKTDRLRPMLDRDLEMVMAWRNAPEVRKNMYTQQVITLAEHQRWWAKIKEDQNSKYLIFEVNDVPAGLVNFTDIDPVHKTAFWGFYTCPSAPRGTGSRMETLALDFAFGPLALNKLCCEVLAFNKAVISLHIKFGFSQEGIFKAHKMLNGMYENVHRLAIFAKDWAANRPEMLAKVSRRL